MLCVSNYSKMSAFNTKDLKTEINTIMLNKPTEDSNTNSKNNMDTSSSNKINSVQKRAEELMHTSESDVVLRPHTLSDLVQIEKLTEETDVETTFSYNDCNEDEEFWLVDIPKTIDPLLLKGQILQLGGNKSTFKIDDDKYSAISRESKSNLTCVFARQNKSNRCKAVNIKPSGTVSVRRKLSVISRNKMPYEKSTTVPFPKNIKLRHPLFGVQFTDE